MDRHNYFFRLLYLTFIFLSTSFCFGGGPGRQSFPPLPGTLGKLPILSIQEVQENPSLFWILYPRKCQVETRVFKKCPLVYDFSHAFQGRYFENDGWAHLHRKIFARIKLSDSQIKMEDVENHFHSSLSYKKKGESYVLQNPLLRFLTEPELTHVVGILGLE